MAATQKSPEELAKAARLAHVPQGDEYEKMISGMLYDSMETGLAASRFQARRRCHEYNNHFPSDSAATFDSLALERLQMLREFIGEVGDDTFIEPPFRVDYGCNIRLGKRFYANFNLIILDCAIVTIGDRVMFGPNVSLLSATHETDVRSRRDNTMATQTIERHEIELVALPERPVQSGKVIEGSGSTEDAPPSTSKFDRATLMKLMSAGFCFFVAGVNDGSTGPLIPYFMRQYGINTTTVSALFAANFFGWFFTAITNTHLCQYFDFGALLALGASCQLIGHALRVWDPPFGLLVFSFWFITVGQAYQDTHANTFVSKLPGAHRWLGFIHAMFMAGSLVGPFVATAVASAGTVSRWYLFYTFPLGLGVANLIWVLVAFRANVGRVPRATSSETDTSDQGSPTSKNASAMDLIKTTLRTPSVWVLSLFFFFFLGAAVTVGGWLVEYLVVVRGGELAHMGYVPAGFNGGCFLGRLLLAEPTQRFGERRMVFIYAVLCIGLQLLFWLVPNIIAASVAVSFLGFFSGPFFATGISVATKLFPPAIHSAALPFVFVIGQIGGSAFPIVTGILAARVGVAVLQPILVALYVAAAVTWLLIPAPKSTANRALHQE
ncbi:major facilitator superfamily domain-containing protein [Chaetomium sp. MPI-CAGE-AT-0009]|nr:major facilitator superfamily domain-containing protein [Chaetomium sp. MPI-CAGE-AT-0009]